MSVSNNESWNTWECACVQVVSVCVWLCVRELQVRVSEREKGHLKCCCEVQNQIGKRFDVSFSLSKVFLNQVGWGSSSSFVKEIKAANP